MVMRSPPDRNRAPVSGKDIPNSAAFSKRTNKRNTKRNQIATGNLGIEKNQPQIPAGSASRMTRESHAGMRGLFQKPAGTNTTFR